MSSLLPFQAGPDLRGDLPAEAPAHLRMAGLPHHQERDIGGQPTPGGLQRIPQGDRRSLPEHGGRRPVRHPRKVTSLPLEAPPGNVERAGQGDPDPAADPRLDARRSDIGGRDEQNDRGKQGKGDEDEYQAGADLGPQDVPLPVQNQLEYVSRDEEDQQDDQDDVDVDECEDDDVAGESHLAADRPQARFQDGKTGHQDGHDPDGNPLPLLLCPVLLRGRIRLPGQKFFHGAERSPLAHSVSTSHREEKKKIERSGSDRPTLSRRVRTSALYFLPRVTSW